MECNAVVTLQSKGLYGTEINKCTSWLFTMQLFFLAAFKSPYHGDIVFLNYPKYFKYQENNLQTWHLQCKWPEINTEKCNG